MPLNANATTIYEISHGQRIFYSTIVGSGDSGALGSMSRPRRSAASEAKRIVARATRTLASTSLECRTGQANAWAFILLIINAELLALWLRLADKNNAKDESGEALRKFLSLFPSLSPTHPQGSLVFHCRIFVAGSGLLGLVPHRLHYECDNRT